MSYSFYSLVSSIKDKSSQAMATLSSDLKEFGSIVQEDVAEISKTVRKTVHEQSEALRQRVEEKQTEEEEDGGEEEEKKEEEEEDAATEEGAQDPPAKEEEKPTTSTSLFASFTGLSLEAMGSKLLQSADELLGSLAGPDQEEEEEDEEERAKLESARRYWLLALQEDAHTYVHPPMDVETFLKWRKALGDEELLAIQEEVLAHYPTVVEKLAELVPETVSSEDFWAHYIYKASLLAAQEQRGADLLEHALNDSEEEVGWDVESPRQGSDNGGSGQSFEEDPVTGDALPMLRTAAASEPSSPAPVLGEQRPTSPSGSDAEDARTSPVDSASSDGESWIELDEQRRELAQQPPLSSSSTSSFVPVDGVYAAVPPAPIAVAVKDVAEDQVLNDEEDVDWGDDVDHESEEAAATTVGSEAQPPKKAGGADWGEWD